jgi:hypothetical protein
MPSTSSPAGGSRAYRRRQGWLAAILAVQLVGGLAVLAAPGQEVFPLFSWFLFPLTPQSPATEPELQLLEYRGQRFDPPVALAAVRDAVTAAQAPVVVALGQDMARAVAAGDEAAADRLRRTLESSLNPGAGRYRLVEVTYDPLARFRHGDTLGVQTLREYRIAQP